MWLLKLLGGLVALIAVAVAVVLIGARFADGPVEIIAGGYMDTTWGRLWKQWPIEAEKDGRALLRIDGTIYERQLVRIKNDPVVAPVVAKIGAKYMGGSSMTSDDGVAAVSNDSLWLFEMAPPNP
jgi:hypothetical protein